MSPSHDGSHKIEKLTVEEESRCPITIRRGLNLISRHPFRGRWILRRSRSPSFFTFLLFELEIWSFVLSL